MTRLQDESTTFKYIFYTVIESLLKHPAIDVNREDNRGLSPLMEASKRGQNKIVEALLFHRNMKVNKATWDDGNTALIYAIMGFMEFCHNDWCHISYLDVVRLLLRCPDTDVFHRNKNFETAYQIANNRVNNQKGWACS